MPTSVDGLLGVSFLEGLSPSKTFFFHIHNDPRLEAGPPEMLLPQQYTSSKCRRISQGSWCRTTFLSRAVWPASPLPLWWI